MTASSDVLAPMSRDDPEVSGHDTRRGGMDPALLGMMLFIASEVMFFAALFAAYFNARATLPVFPPEGYDHILEPVPIALVATTILLLSSLTMQWGTTRIRQGDRTGLNRAVAVTLVLGVMFLAIQLYDYYELITVERFGIDSGVYGTLFYTMTGFHGAHVLGGVVGLAVILSRGVAGQFTRRHHVAVEAVHYYWHFVDVVWVFLFLTLYVIK
ncbi:MAG TPA: cytochrome c oxidase subunit 3 [Candidatus Limnocylindrales bacterium]|nr:cytochrome c oxidase subunit 3 [Candidatus Limnocylindrales bacterium]